MSTMGKGSLPHGRFIQDDDEYPRKPGVFLVRRPNTAGAINSGEGISAISSLNLNEASVVHALPHAFGQSAGGKRSKGK